MEFRRIRRGRWQWELAEKFSEAGPELFALWEDPRRDFRARLARSENTESWFEFKNLHPQLPALLWLRLKEYSEFDALNFFWRSFPLQKSWKVSSRLSPGTDAVARPLAYGWMWKDLRIQTEALLFEARPHFSPLGSFLKENFSGPASHYSPEDRRELLRQLIVGLRELFSRNLSLPWEHGLAELECKLEPDRLKLFFPHPERVRESKPGRLRLPDFLAWLCLELRPHLSTAYLIRFLHQFLRAEGVLPSGLEPLLKEIFLQSELILEKRIRKAEKEFWGKRFPFFWFELKGARVFLRYPVDQNQALELIPSLGLLSRRREKVRVRKIGKKELVECDLTAIPGGPGREHRVGSAFFFSLRLTLENLPHQAPLLGVESPREDYLIYEPLSGSSLALNEYLARLLADELSGRSWDRKFLLRLARLLLRLHERGLVYEDPRGDELWVEELPEGRMNFYLTRLERLRAVGQLEAEFAGKNLFEILRSLPLSEPDALIILEEYLRRSRKFGAFKKNFADYFDLIRTRGLK
jgi:hypothetical protein